MSLFERPATSILHPTDFSPTSQSAFAHALAIAINNKAKLTILHIVSDNNAEVPWHDFPAVRKILERWGYLESGSTRKDVGRNLGINIEKVVGVNKNVVKSIVGIAEKHGFDLIVMATNENREQPFLLKSRIAVPVSAKAKLPTLFVPQDVRGWVSPEDGSVTLKQILLPVASQPDPQPVIERVTWAMEKMGGQGTHVTLLHVGSEDQFPHIRPPVAENFSWSKKTRLGNASREIVKEAKELNADVIAMVTEGKKGFWDVLQGSTVEQVLRHAPCAVFTMPDESW